MPGNKHGGNDAEYFAFSSSCRPVRSFLFSLPSFLMQPSWWMDLDPAKASANSHPAKCQHFCTPACFQLQALHAKCVSGK